MVEDSKEVLQQKLQNTIDECEKHLKWMNNSHEKIKHLFPLNITSYNQLSENIIPVIDQFVYRFTKLQDTIGSRLFNIILLLLAEDPKKMSFIDILNRLEQLNIIDSKESWLKLRNLRNLASHEYNDEENTDILNQLFNNSIIIQEVYIKAKTYIKNKFNKDF